jgi:hypothetical protein
VISSNITLVTFFLRSENYLDFSKDDDDLMIFGALEFLEVTDALDACLSCLFLILDDFLKVCRVSLGSWDTSLIGEVELILMVLLYDYSLLM